MNIGVLAFSDRGMELAERLKCGLSEHEVNPERCESGGLYTWAEAHFAAQDALIFVSSCGIAVRAIAPLVRSKCADPAVVVVDETGRFAVSLLSGHLGGANALADRIAQVLGAVSVVTTATDRNGLFAVDVWAKEKGMTIDNPEKIKLVSGKLVNGQTVGVKSDFPLRGGLPKGLERTENAPDLEISVNPTSDGLRLIPRIVTLGIGCRKGTAVEAIRQAVEALPIHLAAIRQVCSIDLKAQEPGLLAFCRELGVPLVTYSAEELLNVEGNFTGSEFVRSVTGVDNVCERSAVLGGGALWIPKTAANGVTVAAAIADYTVDMEG